VGSRAGKAKFQTDTRPISRQAVVKKAKTSGLGSTTAKKQHTTQKNRTEANLSLKIIIRSYNLEESNVWMTVDKSKSKQG